MEHCDVIIVGAGLSGLTAANALVQSGKSVRVVEVDDAIDDRGAGLGISPSGMSSLESLGPQIFDEVKACSQPAMSQARVFTKEGLPKSPDCTDMPDCTKHAESYGPEGAKGLMMVNWYMLRRILIRGLPSGLPPSAPPPSAATPGRDAPPAIRASSFVMSHDRLPLANAQAASCSG